MSQPLQRRIAALQSRVRRLVTLYGLSWILAMGLGTLMVLGWADYLIRFHDRGIRVICWAVLWGVLGWACYRFLYRGLATRLHDVDLALRIQRRFPALEDRLASAVEFLQQAEDDPTAGSAALRRAVISEATAESGRLDFSDVLDPRPVVRAATATAAVCLVAAIFIVLNPPACRTAAARLLNPFSNLAWPRSTYLELRTRVERVARGQSFELEVVDARGAKFPPEVRIHYRCEGPDGTTAEETDRMRFLGGVMVARRENILRPFSYRVEGGDDNTLPWIAVAVVEPPRIESLAIRLIPPDYTGWPPHESGKSIRALVGTRIQMAARATKPLQSATLCLEDGRKIAAQWEGDDRFRVPLDDGPDLVVQKSEAYWFTLTDREGLTAEGDDRWEIHAVPDAPPTVSIEQPTANVFVTPGAVLPLRVAGKDDLAIHDMTLVFSRSDQVDRDAALVPIYTGPERVEPQPTARLSAAAPSGESRVVEYRWDLAPLELRPGTEVTLHVAATDYRPGTGQSEPRRLSVITPEELQDRLASRQTLILTELARVLKMQQESRSQVATLRTRLDETGRLEQLDVDHLQAAALNQRQVDRTLTSRGEGVPLHILALLADLENNKVDSPDIQRRMQGLLAKIGRLQQELLPLIEQDFTAAIKAAQIKLQDQKAATSPQNDGREKASSAPDPLVAASLAGAGTRQDQVIAALEEMLGQLGQWDNYRRFHREIAQLLREQEDLARRTTELGRGTLSRQLKDLVPQQIADLKTLARQQLDLALRLDQTQEEMRRASLQLIDTDPLAAETVSDAVEEAQRLAVSGEMRTVRASVERNQMGQAVRGQKQIVRDLHEVLDILAGRRQRELAVLLKRLSDAQVDLAGIAARQADLRQRMQQAAQRAEQPPQRQQWEQLGGRQAELEEETKRIARRLQRLLADQPGRTARQAADQMNQAAQSARQGDGPGTCRQAGQAQAALEDAQRQLDQHRRQAEAELAREQLARLEESVKQLHKQQQKVLDETQQLDRIVQAEGRLPPGQVVSLDDLARRQRSLQGVTGGLAENLAAAAFGLALSGAAQDMTRAAGLLEQRQTGPATQQAEQEACRRLDLLLAALRPEPENREAQGAAGEAGGQQGAPRGLLTLAELKLLRLLQQEVNLRTRQLEETVGGARGMDEEARRRYLLLSQEQGQLADLVLQLLQPKPQDLPDDPARLPNLRPQDQQPGWPKP